MSIKVLGFASDKRTETPVIYAQITVNDFLSIVGPNFEDFTIQRRKEKHRAYNRLKEDLAKGALLPTITLSVKPNRVAVIKKALNGPQGDLEKLLEEPNGVNILDGLQRTYIINELISEGFVFSESHTLHLEFWLEENINNLIYRIIILNAGQKPMSLRHQIELLFSTMQQRIEDRIKGLEIYREKDKTKRRSPQKYALDRLAAGYHSYLIKSPEVNKENIVAQQLIESEVLDSTEEELSKKFEEFIGFLKIYTRIDNELFRIYTNHVDDGDEDEEQVPIGANWFGNENVIRSFFASVAQYNSSENNYRRIVDALTKMETELRSTEVDKDVFGLNTFNDIRSGFNPKRVNVGTATRRFITNAFKEYYRNTGDTPIVECWKLASE